MKNSNIKMKLKKTEKPETKVSKKAQKQLAKVERFNAAVQAGVSKINAMRDILGMTDDEIMDAFIAIGKEQAYCKLLDDHAE